MSEGRTPCIHAATDNLSKTQAFVISRKSRGEYDHRMSIEGIEMTLLGREVVLERRLDGRKYRIEDESIGDRISFH